METSDAQQVERRRDASTELVGRYTVIAKIAGGDYTTVYLAHKEGALGFNRLAAVKRLKPAFAKQPEWTQLLLDEARFSAAVRHPNIVDILDVGTDAGVYIVMQYVEGADLDVLISRAGKERHPRYLVPPIVDALTGLHAAHTARDELGEPLGLVHQAPLARHILIGIDGLSRITDFSQASARGMIPSELRDKRLGAAYMAPEQVLVSDPLSARTDVFIAGITLWETLTGTRLFHADTPALARRAVTERHIPKASETGLKPPACFDDICMKALQRNPEQRYQSAHEMAQELRDAALNESLYASASELGQWVRALASRALVERRRALGADAPSQEIRLDARDTGIAAPAVEVMRENVRGEPDRKARPAAAMATSAVPNPVKASAPPPAAAPSFAIVKTPVLPIPAASVPASFAEVQTSNAGAAGSGPATLATPHSSVVDFSVPSEMVPMTNAPSAPSAPFSSPSRADDSARGPRTATPSAQPPKEAAGSRQGVSKSTLIGVSQWPSAPGLPRHALSATMSYEATSAQRSAQRSARHAQSPRSHEESSAPVSPLNTTLAEPRSEEAPVMASGRPPLTLPDGVQLQDLDGGEPSQREQLGAVVQPSKAVGVAEAFAVDPAPHFPLAARPGFSNAYESPSSGAYHTGTDAGRSARHGSEGVMPADIFARVEAAKAVRRGAADSLRPPSSRADDWDDVGGSRRSGLTSLLLVGGLCVAAFFGYRTWSEQRDVARMRAATASLASAGALAVEEPALPVAPSPEALPPAPLAAEPALPEPVLAEPAAPVPAARVPPIEPSRAAPDPAVSTAHETAPAAKPAARRAATPSAHHRSVARHAPFVREPTAQSWATPRFGREPEVLPDNPY